MQIDLQTINIQPLRHTFDHLAKRFGDKPSSRYQEGTYDLQQDYLYHYRPTWEPDREIFDIRRTAIRMRDWYDLKDPRQFYYGTYTIARAKQQESADAAFEFALDSGLESSLPPAVRALFENLLLPMRHVEWGANMNNTFMCAYGYGTAFEAPCGYAAMDRLGIAQQISRIGLAVGGEAALTTAKEAWLTAPAWQPLRQYVEHSFVVKDWFELFVAQNLVLDAMVYQLLYVHAERQAMQDGSALFGLVTKFMKDWHHETARWVDAVVKAVVAESPENRVLVARWVDQYRQGAMAAVRALADTMLVDGAAAADAIDADLQTRLGHLGL